MPIRRQANGNLLVQFQYLGKRVHRSAGTRSVREAKAFEEELRAEIRAALAEPESAPRLTLTLGEALQRYESTHLRLTKGSERSFKSTQCLLRKLQELLGGSAVRLEEIGASEVACLKERLLNAGRAPATVNQYLAFLRALLKRASEEWGVETSGVRFRLLPLRNARVRQLSLDEEQRLLTALERVEPLHRLVRFLLGTGVRLREALQLTWDDVDLEAQTVTLRHTKNGETRLIPLQASELELLRTGYKKAGRSCPWVFPWYSARVAPREYKSPHGAFKSACVRAGVTDFRIHDLRHTFASRCVARGVGLYHVSRLLGHRDLRMTARYSHLGVEDLRTALAQSEGSMVGGEPLA